MEAIKHHFPDLMRNHKTAEKVPQHIKWSSNDGSNVMIWCDSRSHHPIEGEI